MRKLILGTMTALLVVGSLARAQYAPDGSRVSEDSPEVQAQNQLPAAPAQQPPGSQALVQNQQNYNQAPVYVVPQEQQQWAIKGWIGGDFLMAFPQNNNLPANIVTTGAGGAGTQLVGTTISSSPIIGFRIDTGMFTVPDEHKGAQSMTMQLFGLTNTITVPAGNSINTNGGATTAVLGATIPNTFAVNTSFSATDANSLYRLYNSDTTKIYAVYGPKFVALEEDITFNYSLAGAAGVAAGAGNVLDEFHTRNYFIGGQVGLWLRQNFGQFNADIQGRCALGYGYSNVVVLGRNNAAAATNTQFFTNDANIGNFSSYYFSVVPAVNANLSYNLTERIQIRAGYAFLAYINCQRPGDQIVAALAPVAAGGIHTAPAVPFTTATFLIHGFNVGARWNY
jgi:hypothetical protein